MKLSRTGIILKPDNSRVFFRPFDLNNPERVSRVVARLMSLSESAAEKQTPFVTAARPVADPTYEKALFERKLIELGLLNPFAAGLMGQLDSSFSLEQLRLHLRHLLRRDRSVSPEAHETATALLALANA